MKGWKLAEAVFLAILWMSLGACFGASVAMYLIYLGTEGGIR